MLKRTISVYNQLTKNYNQWLRLLIVIALLFLSALQSYLANQRLLLAIPLLFLGVGVLLLLLKWPQLGLFAVIGSIFIPFNSPSNINATLVLIGVLLGLWLLDMVVHQRQIKLLASPTLRPLLALIFVTVLAFGMGQIPWYPFAL